MDFTNKEIRSFLRGNTFSNGTAINITNQKKYVVIRNWYLREIVTSKKILHFGFVDHLPLLEIKIQTNNWLHKIISDTATRCAGIDIDKEGVEKTKELGFSDVYCTNIIEEALPNELKNENWDIVLLGEVLEHVNNPVAFLTQIRNKLKENAYEIIITVPNAFAFSNFVNGFKNNEFINTDHRYWFTPYTLSKIVSEAGFEPYDIKLISTFQAKSFFLRKLLSRFSIFNNDILLRAKF